MSVTLPPGWTQMRRRPVPGGQVVLATRMREATIGPKSLMVEQYVTWFYGPAGTVEGHYYDERRPAEQDFETRH